MPTKLVGIAILAAPIVQVLKVQIPALRGWKSLAANFGICSVAALASCHNPADVETSSFWAAVIETTIAAAGVHGIGKGLGLFPGLFTLPEDLKDPLSFQCPHVDEDGSGRPVYMCKGSPGQACTTRDLAGEDVDLPRVHAERIALVTGGGERMSEQTAAAAAEMADVAPLMGNKVSYTIGQYADYFTPKPLRIFEHVDEELAGLVAKIHLHGSHSADVGQTGGAIRPSLTDGFLPTEQRTMADATPQPTEVQPTTEQVTAVVNQANESAPATAAVEVAPVKLSFFAKTKIFLLSVLTNTPKEELIAVHTVQILATMAGGILAVVAPEDIPILTGVVGAVVGGLQTIATVIQTTGSTVSAQALIDAVKANLTGIEAMVGLKSASAKNITGSIASELDLLVAEFTPAKAS